MKPAPEQDGGRGASAQLVFAAGGALLLFGTMVLACVDVVGRYFLNAPVKGGFELTEIMMAGLIFLGMPLVTRADEHIKVDLLDMFLSPRMRAWQQRLGDLLTLCVSILIAVTVWFKAGQIAASNDHTESLKIPLAPVAYLMAVMMAVNALVCLARMLRPVTKGDEA